MEEKRVFFHEESTFLDEIVGETGSKDERR